MQFSSRLPPFLLRRLRAIVLQLAVPAAVVADTCRSVVVTYRMLEERLQEWEEEDRQDTHREVRAMLQGIIQRCAAKDPDFWPPGLLLHGNASCAALATPPAAALAGEANPTAAADFWQLMGLSSGIDAASAGAAAEQPQQQAGLPQPSAAAGADTAAAISEWARQEEAQLVHHQQQAASASAGSDTGAWELQAAPAAASAAAAQRATLVVVTLQEAVAHVAASVASLELPWSTLMAPVPPPGVVHVTLSDVLSILGATPPAQAAASKRRRLSRRILEAADATGASMRASLPWPQLHLTRKSALRCAVDWHGLTRPGPPPEPLERQLACC